VAKLVFLGTPEVAADTLDILAMQGHEIMLVITRPDKRRGRGGQSEPSPVARKAIQLGLPVSFDPAQSIECGAELGIVVAYGRLIKPEILTRIPMINVHFSLLPRWRGAAPVERAILAGDPTSGVCIMQVVDKLDAGAVYAKQEVAIGTEESANQLRSRLGSIGAKLLVECLSGNALQLPEPEIQLGDPTWASKITSEDLHLDWTQTATYLHRVVRLGRAWTRFRQRRVIVTAALPESDGTATAVGSGQPDGEIGQIVPEADLGGMVVKCGQGVLVITKVQPEGKREMTAKEWMNGAGPAIGECFEA